MSVNIEYGCGHCESWPSCPPSDVLADIRDSVCADCAAKVELQERELAQEHDRFDAARE